MENYKAGDVYYRRRNSRKYHIVAILDKEENPQIVSISDFISVGDIMRLIV